MEFRTRKNKYNKSRLKFMKREKSILTLRWCFNLFNYNLHTCYKLPLDRVNFNKTFYQKLTFISRFESISKIRSFCRITGRETAVSRFFRISRQELHKNHLRRTKSFTGVTAFPYSKAHLTHIKKIRCFRLR